MRLAQMWCRRGFEKTNRRLPWSRNELWRCACEIHILSRSSGRNLGWRFRHSQVSSWFSDWFGLKGLQLINTKIEGPCRFHGRRLGTQPRSVWFWLPENWLQGDARGSHYNGLIMAHLSGIWIESKQISVVWTFAFEHMITFVRWHVFLERDRNEQRYLHPQVGLPRSEVALHFGSQIRHFSLHSQRESLKINLV